MPHSDITMAHEGKDHTKKHRRVVFKESKMYQNGTFKIATPQNGKVIPYKKWKIPVLFSAGVAIMDQNGMFTQMSKPWYEVGVLNSVKLPLNQIVINPDPRTAKCWLHLGFYHFLPGSTSHSIRPGAKSERQTTKNQKMLCVWISQEDQPDSKAESAGLTLW